MESGLTNANRFLEQLDRAEEEGDESTIGEDEVNRNHGVTEIAEDQRPAALMKEHEGQIKPEAEPVGGESAPKPTEDEADHDFFTPLRGLETALKARGPKYHKTDGRSTLRRVDERQEESEEEHSALRRRNEELEAQLAAFRAETSSKVNELEERYKMEAEARAKAEADLAHVKKVAVSPKQHKESLRMIDLLKKELSELEAARAKDEERYRQEVMDRHNHSQVDDLNNEIQRLTGILVCFYRFCARFDSASTV